ncbi:hypothetical protein [Bradyrhizobium sp. LTSPM299]|uniref:hypothetical protein n=1 Tax=Bradyrhizobium sp. LTSPM299 TaxID=1619233 RepID=UPI001FD8D804|nr:hypothetical protein [Bradyrhizobium sp. LTSPM299]
MPVFKLPLSGDVVQNISLFTAFMSPIGSQFGLINITPVRPHQHHARQIVCARGGVRRAV